VLGVIEPGAAAAHAASHSGDVLVIATDATVQSHAYAAACRSQGLRALEKACPLLVPLVEEGWVDHPVTADVFRIYLDELLAEAAAQNLSPDALVLGCTHYPLLRRLIENAVPAGMRVIDSAESAAEAAVRIFNRPDPGCPIPDPASRPDQAWESTKVNAPIASTPQIRCFATDSVEKFQRLGSKFLEQSVGEVELVDLGG
jgi:glutamate racemase